MGRFGLAPFLAALSILLLGCAAWPYSVDDAFIYARYADRLARGLGYTFNDGPPTDGLTGPLWLVPMVVGRWLGAEPHLVAKGVGLVCATLAVFGTVWRARAEDTLASWLTALLLGCGMTLPIWSVAGLETGAATLALAAAAWSLPDTRDVEAASVHRGSSWIAGLAFASIAWLRPEAMVAAGVLLIAHVWLDARRSSVGVVVAFVGLLAVGMFRWTLFGTPVPLVAQAKAGLLEDGVEYVYYGVTFATGIAGIALATGALRSSSLRVRAMACAVAAHVVVVGVLGGDWMPGYRLLVPVLPLYATLAALGARYGLRSTRFVVRAVAVLALLLSCAAPISYGVVAMHALRNVADAYERVAIPLARTLAARYDTVALVDAGVLAYESMVDVVDLGGLTDPRIGMAPGRHLAKRIDVGYLAARDPDAIVVHTTIRPHVVNGELRTPPRFPVERYVANLPWVKRSYRVREVVPYTHAYFYVVFERIGASRSVRNR